ncbi:Bgt-20956 [Blumeria graminis f. sp. tritici]|uniref:Bgt-20956 n=2 Tax=Blumeria graminis f. sp. tritici TaxID=62690 RepID=A0A381L813_BLUGR|nr:Bgt-20956 [Blumeria graminis f. sp. tritici]
MPISKQLTTLTILKFPSRFFPANSTCNPLHDHLTTYRSTPGPKSHTHNLS